MADQQNLRRLGGLVSFLPFTYTAILIGSLSMNETHVRLHILTIEAFVSGSPTRDAMGD